MTNAPERIEKALDEVASVVRAEADYGDFLRHRDRYASDAAIVAEVVAGSRVLEVGSCPGHFTALLKALDMPCIGLDIDPRRLGRIGDHFRLDVRRCDIEREALPLPDGSERVVVFSEVFEHLRVDPLFVLSELNRVLEPGGHMLLTTPNLYSLQQIARYLLGRGFGDPLVEFSKLRALGHMGHVREYSNREMHRFLRYAGFAVQRQWFKHYYFGDGKRGLAKRLLFATAPARFRTFQVILATKVAAGQRLTPLP